MFVYSAFYWRLIQVCFNISEADKTLTAVEATETLEITKDIATLAEDTTKDDLENSKAVPDAPEAETDIVQTENTETEKSKDSIEIEASKDSAEIEASNEPSENQATDENSQETAGKIDF